MEEKDIYETLIEEIERQVEEICEEGITVDNVKYLSEIVDIHKDIKNEMYWEEKIDCMRYRNFKHYSENQDQLHNEEHEKHGSENMDRIEIMTDSLADFIEHIKRTARTPEEKQFIVKKIQELTEM